MIRRGFEKNKTGFIEKKPRHLHRPQKRYSLAVKTRQVSILFWRNVGGTTIWCKVVKIVLRSQGREQLTNFSGEFCATATSVQATWPRTKTKSGCSSYVTTARGPTTLCTGVRYLSVSENMATHTEPGRGLAGVSISIHYIAHNIYKNNTQIMIYHISSYIL